MLKEQVLEAAEIIGEGNVISKEEALKQIGISPQCSFRVLLRRRMLEEMVGELRLIRRAADGI